MADDILRERQLARHRVLLWGVLWSGALAGCSSAALPRSCPECATAQGHEVGVRSCPEVGEVAGSGKTLVLDGVESIPADLQARFARYSNARQASVLDLDAAGGTMLVSTRFGETSQVHRIGAPMAAREQLTFLDEPVASARFARDGRDILYSVDVGGNENFQLHRLDLTSGQSSALTDPGSKVLSFVLTDDGKSVFYASNARNGVDFDLWSSDGHDAKKARRIADGQGMWYPLDVTARGDLLLAGAYRSIRDSSLFLVDPATGKVTPLTDDSAPAAHPEAVLSRDGKTVYAISDREGEFAELYALEVSSRQWTPLSREIPWNVEALALSPDGKTLAFSVNEGGRSTLYLRELRGASNRQVPGLPAGSISGLRFARERPVLALSVAAAEMPGDAFTYDLKSRKLARWTQSELGGIPQSALVAPGLVDYVTFDGAKIPAWYYRPEGSGPFPVVVDIHGGPEGQARPRYSALTQYLVRESRIAVIQPNVRGSDGYGKTYLSLDDGKKREDSVKDIGALLDWIDAQPELDGKRVAVMGGSYGGYMVLASLVHFGERIRAGIDVVGISSFVTFLRNTAGYRQSLRRAEYGDESDPEMAKFLESISPLGQVDKIRSALFVAQGANDPRVPASEAEQIVTAVRKSGKTVWYMLAKDEGHGFRKKYNRDTYAQLAALFLEQRLRD